MDGLAWNLRGWRLMPFFYKSCITCLLSNRLWMPFCYFLLGNTDLYCLENLLKLLLVLFYFSKGILLLIRWVEELSFSDRKRWKCCRIWTFWQSEWYTWAQVLGFLSWTNFSTHRYVIRILYLFSRFFITFSFFDPFFICLTYGSPLLLFFLFKFLTTYQTCFTVVDAVLMLCTWVRIMCRTNLLFERRGQ